MSSSPRAAGLWVLLLTCACENPGIDEGTATLRLLKTVPEDDASEAPIAGPVLMEFNESIAHRSLTDAFRLENESGHQIFGALTVDGKKVRFDPETPLSLSQHYRVTVTDEIRGAKGASLASPVAWKFSTTAGELGSAQKIGSIEAFEAGMFQMSVAIDEQARMWAVWLDDTITFGQQAKVRQPMAIVVAEQSTDRSSWQRRYRYEAPNFEAALLYVCLVWDKQHNGYLVWQQRTLSDDRIQLARFDAEEGRWGTPQPVTTVGADINLFHPRCVLDPQLGLQIVWVERFEDQTNNALRQRVYDVVKEHFLEPELLLSSSKDEIVLAVLSLQRTGSTTRLTYASEELSALFLRVATLQDGTVSSNLLVSELSPTLEEIHLKGNRRGASFLLWKDAHDRDTTSLWALHRNSDDTGWSSPRKIVEQPKDRDVDQSQLSVDATGDAFVSWRETDGDSRKFYYVSYDSASKRWDEPTLFQSIDGSSAHASTITAERRPMIIGASTQSSHDSVWYSEQASSWTKPVELAKHRRNAVVFPLMNLVSMQTGQFAGLWYERMRHTVEVGGVLLGYDSLDLWGVMYQPKKTVPGSL